MKIGVHSFSKRRTQLIKPRFGIQSTLSPQYCCFFWKLKARLREEGRGVTPSQPSWKFRESVYMRKKSTPLPVLTELVQALIV